MMPLALANIGEEYMIRRVSGNPEVKKHLEDLGLSLIHISPACCMPGRASP